MSTTGDTDGDARPSSPEALGLKPALEVPTVAQYAPVITTEVPVISGDILREINTPAVSPPKDPLADAVTTAIGSPQAGRSPVVVTESSGASSASAKDASPERRFSAGAALAEKVGIDLNAIGRAEARKIMSAEHKALGFRPPHGSLAAEAQAAAAKHPDGAEPEQGASRPARNSVDVEKLKEAARVDALRILAERAKDEEAKTDGADETPDVLKDGPATPGTQAVDDNLGLGLGKISEEDARTLMSYEHRALGFRPPPGSLAAQVQGAVASAKSDSEKPTEKDGKSPETSTTEDTSGQGKVKQRRLSNNLASSKGVQIDGAKGRRRTMSMGENSGDKERTKLQAKAHKRQSSGSYSAAGDKSREEKLKVAATRDAFRIKATRGVDATGPSENGDVKVETEPTGVSDLTKQQSPPAQKAGVAPAGETPTAAQKGTDGFEHNKQAVGAAVAGRAEGDFASLNDNASGGSGDEADRDDEQRSPPMRRWDTEDSVQIVM